MPMVLLRLVTAEEAQRVRAALAELAARDCAVIELLFSEQLRCGFTTNRAASASAGVALRPSIVRHGRRAIGGALHDGVWCRRAGAASAHCT